MKMSNKVYDVMKWLTVIVLPALATLYTVLADSWKLPYAEQMPQQLVHFLELA